MGGGIVLAATWGIGWAMLGVAAIFVFVAYVVLQGTRAQNEWRRQVLAGNLDVIQQLVTGEVERWKRERPPKDVSAAIWRAVQGIEVLEIGADYIRAATTAEARFQTVDGQRREVSPALDEAMKITVRLADMFMYDLPHVRPDRVQLDIYTTFRDERGATQQECILSTIIRREQVVDADWDGPAEAFIRRVGGRYQLDGGGRALPVTPDADTVRNGHRTTSPRELRPFAGGEG